METLSPWAESPDLLSRQGGDVPPWLSLSHAMDDLLGMGYSGDAPPPLGLFLEDGSAPAAGQHVARVAAPEAAQLPAAVLSGAPGPGDRQWRCLTCGGACRCRRVSVVSVPPPTKKASHAPPALAPDRLHPTHRGTPPPGSEDVDAFCLVGQAGHKNGEKLLRTALVACSEWRDTDVREAAAQQALADGLPELAAILVAKDSSRLRKAQFLWLCRHWGYASRFWQRKKRGPEGRQRQLEVTPPQGVAEDTRPRRRRRVDAAADEHSHLALPSRLVSALGTVDRGMPLALRQQLTTAVSAYSLQLPELDFQAALCAHPDASLVVLSEAKSRSGEAILQHFLAAVRSDGVTASSTVASLSADDLEVAQLWVPTCCVLDALEAQLFVLEHIVVKPNMLAIHTFFSAPAGSYSPLDAAYMQCLRLNIQRIARYSAMALSAMHNARLKNRASFLAVALLINDLNASIWEAMLQKVRCRTDALHQFRSWQSLLEGGESPDTAHALDPSVQQYDRGVVTAVAQLASKSDSSDGSPSIAAVVLYAAQRAGIRTR